MARFRLLASKHYERGSGPKKKGPHNLDHMTLYTKGDIITTDEDLVEKFPNRFERIIEAGPVVVSQARREAVAKLIESETWTEDDKTFLEELPDSGFNRILRQSGQDMPKDPEAGEEPVKHTQASSILGDEVTEEYPVAAENNLKVFKNAAGVFQITKGKSKKPVNPDPLEEVQVEEFIKDYLEQ